MTRLTRNVTRLVVAVDRRGTHEELVLTLAPEGIYIRRPRQRQTSAKLLPYAVASWEADKRHDAAQRAERKRRKSK